MMAESKSKLKMRVCEAAFCENNSLHLFRFPKVSDPLRRTKWKQFISQKKSWV